MLLPGIANEEVGGLYGEVGEFADMSGVGLSTSFHIVCLKIVDVDALVVEHAIEAIYRKLLIDAVDGGLDIFLALIEIVSVDRAEGCLFQIGAAAEQQSCREDICR